jgi:histidine kinase/histidine kinase/DNA gyrase B/HSP90-like ATPase
MHPIFARGRLALYLGSWLLVGGLLAALLVGQTSLTWVWAVAVALPLAAAYAFVCQSAWYVARGMPLATSPIVRVVATALMASLISASALLLAAHFWIRLLTARGWLGQGASQPALLDGLIFGLGVLLYLLSLAVSYLIITFEESRDAEGRALRVQVLAREAELRTLRAQIDPHFLFNSLNSISALTTVDPAGARAMCLLLGEFLRASLALEGEERITLARELRLAEHFLAVERVRFGERLRADIQPGDAGACMVPPLLLQPIVENAITHGLAHMLEGGTVAVRASCTSSTLSIVIENPCDPDRPRGTGTGVGLANVRARLRALHGAEGRIHATEQAGTWRVQVSLPVVTEPS